MKELEWEDMPLEGHWSIASTLGRGGEARGVLEDCCCGVGGEGIGDITFT